MTHSSTLNTLLLILLCVLFFQGCLGKEKGLPAHVEQAKNLSVLKNPESFNNQFKLEKVLVFEDSLLLDLIHDIEIDDSGRVYIAGEGRNRRQVHIFDPDGSYADSLGAYGQGFSEFQSIDHIRHLDNTLYLFDHMLNRVSLYHTEANIFADTLSFNIDQLRIPDELNSTDYEATPISMIDPNRFVVGIKDNRNPAYEPKGTIRYFLSDSTGILYQDEIIHQPDLLYQIGDYTGRPVPFTLSLPERSIFYVSTQKELYAVHTAEFFIRVFDKQGEEKQAFYFPYKREVLDPDEVVHPRYSHNRQLLMTYESAKYHDKWPALFSLLTDDENHIWVSTITENRKEFEWWIIDQTNGQIVNRFKLSAELEIIMIKNRHVYTIEENDMGFQQVVKYSLIEKY